jgi:hypothetical protein
MSTTKITPSEAETSLILALINSSTLSNIPWATIATDLNVSNQAAKKRWSRFKAKIGGTDKTVSPAEVELLLSIVKTALVSGIAWPAVANELDINVQAAQKRWARFKAKLLAAAPAPAGNGGGQSLNVGGGSASASASGSTKTAGGGKAKSTTSAKKTSPKKRKAFESEDDGEVSVAEGGPVVGGSAQKRARMVKLELKEAEEESNDEDGDGDEMDDGQEGEEDEYFDAEAYYGESEDI